MRAPESIFLSLIVDIWNLKELEMIDSKIKGTMHQRCRAMKSWKHRELNSTSHCEFEGRIFSRVSEIAANTWISVLWAGGGKQTTQSLEVKCEREDRKTKQNKREEKHHVRGECTQYMRSWAGTGLLATKWWLWGVGFEVSEQLKGAAVPNHDWKGNDPGRVTGIPVVVVVVVVAFECSVLIASRCWGWDVNKKETAVKESLGPYHPRMANSVVVVRKSCWYCWVPAVRELEMVFMDYIKWGSGIESSLKAGVSQWV